MQKNVFLFIGIAVVALALGVATWFILDGTGPADRVSSALENTIEAEQLEAQTSLELSAELNGGDMFLGAIVNAVDGSNVKVDILKDEDIYEFEGSINVMQTDVEFRGFTDKDEFGIKSPFLWSEFDIEDGSYIYGSLEDLQEEQEISEEELTEEQINKLVEFAFSVVQDTVDFNEYLSFASTEEAELNDEEVMVDIIELEITGEELIEIARGLIKELESEERYDELKEIFGEEINEYEEYKQEIRGIIDDLDEDMEEVKEEIDIENTHLKGSIALTPDDMVANATIDFNMAGTGENEMTEEEMNYAVGIIASFDVLSINQDLDLEMPEMGEDDVKLEALIDEAIEGFMAPEPAPIDPPEDMPEDDFENDIDDIEIPDPSEGRDEDADDYMEDDIDVIDPDQDIDIEMPE